MRKYRLETLLILAVALLIGQLAWPTVARWWRRPSPGTIGVDRWESNTNLAADFLVYLPADYGKTPCPLVVFLHGGGECGADPTILRSWGPFAAVQNGTQIPAVIVGPQCLPASDWQPDAVAQFIEQATSTYRVDRDRIYLIGYSMGGFGTWRTAAAHPELLAAIVPISGGGEPEKAKALAELSVWAFHGAKDEAVPVVESERMVEAIRAAGGQPRLTVFPDAGHGICQEICLRVDLWNWLLAQHHPIQSQR